MTSFVKGCTALIGIAAFAGAATADVNAQRISIDDFARGVETTTAIPMALTEGDRASVLCWNNGAMDNVTAHQAQATDIGFFQTADDFIVKHGFYKYVDYIEVCFLISNNITGIMVKPNLGLNIYNDCDGRPDTLHSSVIDPEKITATLVGPSATFIGFNVWTVRYEVKEFLAGYGRWWISPYGIDNIQDGLYFWASANLGQIQGAQGQLKNGAEPWMDVQDCDCPGICTDFCFQIYGHRCCLAKNNVPFDVLGGGKSLQLKGALVDTSRAADNFQVGPHNRVDLCRVEAYMATNCPLDKVFFEIYTNECNMPLSKLYTSTEEPLWTDTGFTFMGVPIYCFSWPELMGYELDPGRDYWISIVARGTGSILDKAFWMYLSDVPLCNINITEGKVKDVFVEGLEDFTFVSEATLGPPRDFAFRLWTNEIGARSEEPTGTEVPATQGNTPSSAPLQGSQSFSSPFTR